jgi:hypothetical protein
MIRRTHRLVVEATPESRSQLVRDLATLRDLPENPGQPREAFTADIIGHLVELDRLDEACAEAETLPAEGRGVPVTVGAIEQLARACVSHKDERAERWVRRFLKIKGTGREHLQMQSALVGLLVESGRSPESLEAFEAAVAELNALRKKTSKSTLVALTGGSGDAFAVGYWADATKALEELRKPVVGAAAAAAAAEAKGLAAEVQRIAANGDPAGASVMAIDASRRLGPVIKRLKPLAAELSRPDRAEVMESFESIVSTLEVEGKRLKKAAKRR